MKSKHTKGKWIPKNIKGFPRFRDLPRIESEDGSLIAECGGGNCETVEANAKLIAAAPQLLEALMNLGNDNKSIPDHAWNMVQEAINNATK